IFWINGSAGTGKTTIAYTACKRCHDASPSVLGASFFCSMDDVECSSLSLIFPTISHQLGVFNPVFGSEVSTILKANPDVAYASPHYQLEELIVKPLASVRGSFRRCVIVLDALDECQDSATISTVLSALSRFVSDLAPLKFLVTSRPETRITMTFAHPAMCLNSWSLVLHQVELRIVEADIRTYLTSRLARTKALYGLPEDWPSKESIDALARLSSGLFIFASTGAKFIEDPFYSDPRNQLAVLLRTTPRVVGPSSPFDQLDKLYAQVLTLAYPDIAFRHLRALRTVLGSIIHIRDPLTPRGLENLLAIGPGRVRESLIRLHSVIIVPEDDNQYIRLLHPSFFDFLSDPTRGSLPWFSVGVEEQNTLLALACLRTMNRLTPDICNIGAPCLLNLEITDLPNRIATHIGDHVKYASRHWAYHISIGALTDMVLRSLDQFCAEHLLNWIEVCSLLGELREALLSIGDLYPKLLKTTLTLIRDCERLIREFFPIISISALQVYDSVLLFAPDRALIRRKYGPRMDLQIRAYNAAEQSWSTCHLWTFQGHMESVEAVAVCSDEPYIASGSVDTTIRLWDLVACTHLQTFRGHSGPVLSVAFSSTGILLASGSADRTVRLWDISKNFAVRVLRTYPEWVLDVAFSPDDAKIAVGGSDQAIWICDTATGFNLRGLKGHAGRVTSVAFSSDGRKLVSGSMDHTVRLWNTASGANVLSFEKHTEWVMSVAFSGDCKRIVSGSEDKTIRVWDLARSPQLQTLGSHDTS
ncbi:hypothetical protein K438DRAFT_1418070, partial [Mycena galopus ATCC 62051]